MSRLSTTSGRALGLAFAALMLGASIASAGDDGDLNFDTRDVTGTPVLCVYPDTHDPMRLDYLRVKGPRVMWPGWHPLATGSVGWRVFVHTAPTRTGPWKLTKKTPVRYLRAVKDEFRTFANRDVDVPEVAGSSFVRATVKIIWYQEDGGVLGWIRHGYPRYGLVGSDGSVPQFGDQTSTRSGRCPNLWHG
jgi:hypothetical protein